MRQPERLLKTFFELLPKKCRPGCPINPEAAPGLPRIDGAIVGPWPVSEQTGSDDHDN